MNFNKNNISISIIIPVYNAGKFLVETIESVLQQNFESFELILINDGSTDDSAAICEDYHKNDARIKYFAQKNYGVSVARNLGLSYAVGEYIYFLDSDDTLDPDFLKTSYDVAKRENSDIVIVGEYYCKRLPNVTALPTCAQFLRSDFLKRFPDVKFPDYIQPCEDGLFSHQLIALTKNIGANPKGIYNYRQHENQNHYTINKNVDSVLKQIPIWFEILERFYKKHHLFESHAFHLALFIEHEPFEFRYLGMPLHKQQKENLYQEIKVFFNRFVIENLKEEDYKKLSEPFLYLINCESSDEFDIFYKKYVKNRALNKKIRLFFAKLIPFSKLRRRLRAKINEKYS